jgi:gluconolactonase
MPESTLLQSGYEPLASGHDSTEGPTFDREGNLYFVNWLSSSIMRRTPDGTVSEWFNTGGMPAGLAFHRDGSLYVADEGDDIHAVLRITPERVRTVMAESYRGVPLNGANDLVFDQQGVLYFSDPWRSSIENPIGAFYRLFPDGSLEQLDRGLAFPNGVALAPDGSAVYLAETRHNRVLRYRVGPHGEIGERESWARFDGEAGPDGMAFDQEGRLYVAQYRGGCIDVVAPNGSVVERLPAPGSKPTNVAFGGPDRRTLVVTEIETAAVYAARVRTPGAPLFGDATSPDFAR